MFCSIKKFYFCSSLTRPNKPEGRNNEYPPLIMTPSITVDATRSRHRICIKIGRFYPIRMYWPSPSSGRKSLCPPTSIYPLPSDDYITASMFRSYPLVPQKLGLFEDTPISNVSREMMATGPNHQPLGDPGWIEDFVDRLELAQRLGLREMGVNTHPPFTPLTAVDEHPLYSKRLNPFCYPPSALLPKPQLTTGIIRQVVSALCVLGKRSGVFSDEEDERETKRVRRSGVFVRQRRRPTEL